MRRRGAEIVSRALTGALASTSASSRAASSGALALASPTRGARAVLTRGDAAPFARDLAADPFASLAYRRAHATASSSAGASASSRANRGFADTRDDDMGFVEVDLSMVGSAATRTDPVAGGRADGDVDWASIDFAKVCHYRVEVTTAAVRGAGTSGRVEITFIGDKGVSPPIPLEYEQDQSPGFMRGATLPFRVVNYNDVGALRQVQVKLTPELSQVGHGWMLESVSVSNEETARSYVFRSRKWFGESDCGGENGPLQQLLLASPDAAPETRAAFAEGLARRPLVNLQTACAAACVPHADKTKEGTRAVMQKSFGYAGEDAYFIARRNQTANEEGAPREWIAFGVADGVYMWRNLGIDAGLFSRRLMGVASDHFARDAPDPSAPPPDPSALLEAAYEGALAERIKGSATACVATVDAAHGVMRTANVGDSGFMLIRGDPGSREVAHRSPHQEHEFGRPFQLGHHDASDKPADAMLTTFPLEPGDVVVMGSDGLWDNLSEREILACVEQVFHGTGYQRGMGAEKQGVLNDAARAVVSAAYQAAMDKRRTTPYSLAATENFDMVYSGGKKDDITAVVVNVG